MRVTCRTDWRGPCVLCTIRDRPDRQVHSRVSQSFITFP
jgi:hypothetical protein